MLGAVGTLSMAEWNSVLAALGLLRSYSKMLILALNFQIIECRLCVAVRSAFHRPLGSKN